MTISIEKRRTSKGKANGYRLTTELLVKESREEVFAFFADAFQLETLTPAWLHFSVQTPPPIDMRDGTIIDYKLRLHGLPVRWRSQISRWRPPDEFVDQQLRGPYQYWHHLHAFSEVAGGTLVTDVVDYRVALGFIAHPLLVRRDLTKIFAFRQSTMREIFTPVTGSAITPAGSMPSGATTERASGTC